MEIDFNKSGRERKSADKKNEKFINVITFFSVFPHRNSLHLTPARGLEGFMIYEFAIFISALLADLKVSRGEPRLSTDDDANRLNFPSRKRLYANSEGESSRDKNTSPRRH